MNHLAFFTSHFGWLFYSAYRGVAFVGTFSSSMSLPPQMPLPLPFRPLGSSPLYHFSSPLLSHNSSSKMIETLKDDRIFGGARPAYLSECQLNNSPWLPPTGSRNEVSCAVMACPDGSISTGSNNVWIVNPSKSLGSWRTTESRNHFTLRLHYLVVLYSRHPSLLKEICKSIHRRI